VTTNGDAITLYDAVGGEPTFEKIVEVFYGGLMRYIEERGHPRLRVRHNPFVIDQTARDHWLAHMLAAVDAAGVQEPMRATMRQYFEFASTAMINVDISLRQDGS